MKKNAFLAEDYDLPPVVNRKIKSRGGVGNTQHPHSEKNHKSPQITPITN